MRVAGVSVTLTVVGADVDLAELVRRHQKDLWRYLRVLGCPADAAEEHAQHAFVVLWRKDAASGAPARDAAFLRKVARDAWISDRRRARRSREWVAAVDRLWGEDVDGDGWIDALRACRDELTGRPAAAIAAVYDRGLGRADAARELGMQENGLKTLLQRARAALADCVQRRRRREEAR